MKREFKHFSYDDRIALKSMLQQGKRKSDIALSLGCHDSAVYREIKRGDKDNNGNYDPDYAESQYRRNLKNKGQPTGSTICPELAEYIAKLILYEGLSPAKVIARLSEENPSYEYPASYNTIYAAIDAGVIPGVTRENLKPNKTTMFSNGLVQIPKWMRDKLGLCDGSTIFYSLTADESIVLRKAIEEDDANAEQLT